MIRAILLAMATVTSLGGRRSSRPLIQADPGAARPREYFSTLVAPITKGQKVGTVKVMLDGKVIAQRPLVALNAVEEGGFFKRLWDEFWMWWESE